MLLKHWYMCIYLHIDIYYCSAVIKGELAWKSSRGPGKLIKPLTTEAYLQHFYCLDGTWEFAFLIISQMRLILLVKGQHFENWFSLIYESEKSGFNFDCYLLDMDHGQDIKDPQVLFYLILKNETFLWEYVTVRSFEPK